MTSRKAFFARIADFAFFPYLNSICTHNYGKSVYSLLDQKRYKDIVAALIESGGLNYGQLPKRAARVPQEPRRQPKRVGRTSAEGAQYAVDKHGNVRVHFTVSEDHIPLFESRIEELKGWMQMLTGVKYDITLSVRSHRQTQWLQTPTERLTVKTAKSSSAREDTARSSRTSTTLTPDVIFIKNIDNVVPDALRDTTVLYKKVIGGILVATKQKADEYCRRLEKGLRSEEEADEMLAFLKDAPM